MTTRQWMRDVWLRFAGGKVTGGGWDWVGQFSFAGRYDLETGKVTLRKQYLNAHGLAYEGVNENDGQWVWGLWSMHYGPGYPPEQGGFHLWPKGVHDPTQPRLEAEADVPVEELVPA